jgi:hypothetical protein
MNETNKDILTFDERLEVLEKLDDEQLQNYTFSLISNPQRPDIDPVTLPDYSTGYGLDSNFQELQKELLQKYFNNPQISSTTRDYIGRMTGHGFSVYSDVQEVDEKLKWIFNDYRNRLHTMLPKFAGRAFVQGELFLVLTIHSDGFVEVDMMSPETLDRVGYSGSGKILHPQKPAMPLAYQFEFEDNNGSGMNRKEIIPSIFVARYPELDAVLKDTTEYKSSVAVKPEKTTGKFKELKYNKFVVEWDKGLLTSRNISHIASVLTYINYHEALKRLGIDFKKSVSTYVWAVEIDDPKAFRQWLSLSDEEKAATGIMARKEAGSTIILPPSMKLKAMNPQLPKLSGDDQDVLLQVMSGLNVSDDSLMGTSGRNKSGLSETHGTQSDRTSDEIASFERFLRWDLFGNILYLISKVDKSFKYEYKLKKVVDFKNKKPVKRFVAYTAPELVEFTFPTSQNQAFGDRVSGYLGVKHGDLSSSLGIPKSVIAKELGLSSYEELRKQAAEEEDKYPELVPYEDQESVQEKNEAEPARKKQDEKE